MVPHNSLLRGVFLCVVLCTWSVQGQDQAHYYKWTTSRTLDACGGYAMRSGNYLLVSNQMNPDGVVTMMCDAEGTPLWVRKWDGPAFQAYSPGEFNNGDPYVVWWDYAWPESSLHAVRMDADGNMIWQRSYPLGGPHYVNLGKTFVVPDGAPDAGTLRVFEPGDASSIIEIGENGDLLSYTSYDDDPGEYRFAWDMTPTSDGGSVVCGETDYVPMVFKVDHLGAVCWKRRIQLNEGNSFATGVKQTIDGGFVLVVNSQSFGRSVVVKLTADGEFQWARTMEVFSDGVRPTEVLEDENGDLFLTGSGAILHCTYWLSSTGELLGSSIIGDTGWGYISDLHWIGIHSGVVTAVASISLDPLCLYPNMVGLGWLHGPAALPVDCFSEPLTVVFGDHPGVMDTLVPISLSPMPSATETSSYQPTIPTAHQLDFCTVMHVGAVSANDNTAVLWPDPLRVGEPLHVSGIAVLDLDQVRLLDDAGRSLPCDLQQDGAGRYALDTHALTPGHYTLVLGSVQGATAKGFVLLK